MDMKFCNYFLEIAKLQNLSKAAERLYVSQPALSQYISREENKLGVQLFTRKHNLLILTPAGLQYYRACQDILDRRDALYQELASITSCKVGSASIGITPQWGCKMFADIYHTFNQEYPNYSLNIVENTTIPLQTMTEKGDLDMAVLAFNHIEQQPLEYQVICKQRFILAVPTIYAAHIPNNNGNSAFPIVDLKQFGGLSFILSQHGTAIREIQDEIFASNGMHPHTICEINHFGATLHLVADGLGASIIPAIERKENPAISYFLMSQPWHWTIGIIYRRKFIHNAVSDFLTELIRRHFYENGGSDPLCEIEEI